MSINPLLKEFDKKMNDSISSLSKDLSSIRTGRAHSSMLDLVKVEVYGQLLPINQVGTVSALDAQTISVNVWDSNNVKFVEKSIRESDLNLNPIVDGQLLRIPVPKLIKIVSQQSEKIKISIRNIRREGMDFLKDKLKSKEISEDDNKKITNELQKLTDSFTKKVDDKIKEKEKEISTV
jgi:ribosome recycling factor